MGPSWIQLVREWPPGYGGVERVAHELASAWVEMGHSPLTISLRGPGSPSAADPLPVNYRRSHLPSLTLGQLLIPLPHPGLIKILISQEPLHIHLPCPGLLIVSVLARLVRPARRIRLHWHAFLEPGDGPKGWLTVIYQWLALRWATFGVREVVTTSPMLAEALVAEGIPLTRITVMPCCLSAQAEAAGERIWARRRVVPRRAGEPFRLLFIGRLDSYKRVDWLIEALPASGADELHIVGNGPDRAALETMAARGSGAATIRFHGQLSEEGKQHLLEDADLLVLPADRSNEAFGIAQLEAMVCGIPAMALQRPRSGMAWVGGLGSVLAGHGLGPLRRPEQLVGAIRLLREAPGCLGTATVAARSRYLGRFARTIWLRQAETLAR